MKFAPFICALLMMMSEAISLLISTPFGAWIYRAIGIDIEYTHANCSNIIPLTDMNKCYIDGMRAITYVTRWPYLIGYSILFALSFYSIRSYFICVTMSLVFLVYGLFFYGLTAVAPWINFFVLLICGYRARKIIAGT